MPYDEEGYEYEEEPDAGDECDCEECRVARSVAREESEYSPREQTTADDIPANHPPALALLIPELSDRPARLVSFEQEIGGDANACVDGLYGAGLTSENRMYGYGSDRQEFCHVEDDSSVDGEIIFSKMRLNNPAIARKLEDGQNVIQDALRSGDVKLDTRCGFHVHVGLGYTPAETDRRTGETTTREARCYSMSALQSLYHLWNHLEDTIYRLASANWQNHRTEVASYNYARAPQKGLRGAVQIGRIMQGDRYALNLSNFLGARGYCQCGAFDFGDWSECTCSELPKATVEFRVFNATANKRKIRAYIALCLALVAYAEQNEVSAESHPEFGWQGTRGLDSERSDAALRFILHKLPLTEQEREDIRYCAERSSLRDVVRSIRRRKGYRKNL